MKLVINGSAINVERADDHASRQLGLMYRNFLPQDAGMLFSFPNSEERSFWMKNTYIPLSIAYLDVEGKILNIEDMDPHNQNGVRSAGPAMFALEANKGWFTERGVSAGDIVQGLLGNTSLQEAANFNLQDSGFHYSDVVQPIIQQTIDNLKTGIKEGEFLTSHSWDYPIAPDVWIENWEDEGAAFFDVSVDISFVEFPEDHPGWNIDADAGWGESSEALVNIKIQLAPDFNLDETSLRQIQQELSNVVPHEIHHLTQHGNPFERPNCPAMPPASGNSYFDYFTQSCEIPAFLVGFRGEAKASGMAVEKLIDGYLNNYVNVGKITNDELTKVKNTWLGHTTWDQDVVEESLLRDYIRGVLLEVTSLPKEYFDVIDDFVSASKFWEEANSQEDIDIISNRSGDSLGTPAAEALAQALQDAFDELELDIDAKVSSHETDDISEYTLHSEHPAYPDRWLIDACWYVSKQNPGRNTVDMEMMTAEEEIPELDSSALMRHITQTVRHELVHYKQMKKQGENKGLDDTAAFEEMLQDPSQIPSSGKIEDYLRSHIEIDAHAHDGAEELLAVYGKEKALGMLRKGFDLSDRKMPNAIKHYFEQLPASDPTLDKFRSKLYSQIQQMSP
jgi:uncharacterized membrane protein (UPF0127 family)/predicted SprT family Zn-dependent metalloprotease